MSSGRSPPPSPPSSTPPPRSGCVSDLALVTFLLAPLFLVAARRFAGRIRTASQEERAADGAITSVVEESLGNVVLTQAYNRRRAEEKRADREARAWMRASVRGARASEMWSSSSSRSSRRCACSR